MSRQAQTRWHQLQAEEVVRLLETDLQSGLSAPEVKRRQKEYGPNQVTARSGTPAWKRFLLQFHQLALGAADLKRVGP